jgi:hypothetical protein
MRLQARAGGILVASVLLMTLAAPAMAKPQNLIKYYFINSGTQLQADGSIHFMVNKAQTFFTIRVSDMTPGPYDIVLNGAVVDTITVDADGQGKVTHRIFGKGKKAGGVLAYDPRGGDLSIQAAGVELLGAVIPATAAEAQAKVTIATDLANLGGLAGTSKAVLKSRFGRTRFDVRMEGAVPGTYDLVVAGVSVGQIVVDASGSGEVEFASRPDDSGLSELLTFDPRGQSIQIMQGGTSMFEATFPLS